MKDMEAGSWSGNGNANEKGKEPPQESNINRIPPPPTMPPKQCPRCFSTNTRFCYYNNRSALQPRYLCKSCKRNWTLGGALRNVPIGGVCRKSTKKTFKGDLSSNSSSSCSSSHIRESSRLQESLPPPQTIQPPPPTMPQPLLANMSSFSNMGLPFGDSFTYAGGLSSAPFSTAMNLNRSQGFNIVPSNGVCHIGSSSGIQDTHLSNYSLSQGTFGSLNVTGPQQTQPPVYQSQNGLQVTTHPNRPIDSFTQTLLDRPSGPNFNSTWVGSNNDPEYGLTVNNQNNLLDDFDWESIVNLLSGSSPPPPF